MQNLGRGSSERHALAVALWSAALASALVACDAAQKQPSDESENLRQESDPMCGEDDAEDEDEEPSGDSSSDDGSDDGNAPPSGDSSLFCEALAVIRDACQDCHGEELGGGAPMPLVDYDDFTADAPISAGEKVYDVVKSRIHDTRRPMPPQGPLSAAQLAAIDAWVDAGAEPGDDPTCANQGSEEEPPVLERQWPPEGSDECHEFTVPNHTIQAGTEVHPQFFFDAPWGTDEVQALGFRPVTKNKKVLHHWILYSGTGVGGFLSGWAPGQDGTVRKPLPSDVGIAMPSGARAMRLDMHYYNLQGTTDEQDTSGVEVCVTRNLRKNPAGTYMGFVGIPVLPPGEKTDIVGTCNVTANQPVYILSESPHAHELAYHMKFEVIRGGERIVLRDAPFNFEEQTARALDEPFELKTGDQVITTCQFDNTTNQMVFFGENTGNEMCFNFATIYPLGALNCGLFGAL